MKKVVVCILLILTFTSCDNETKLNSSEVKTQDEVMSVKENEIEANKVDTQDKGITVNDDKNLMSEVTIDRLKIEGLSDEENIEVNDIFKPALDKVEELFNKGISNATQEEQEYFGNMMDELVGKTIKKYPNITEEDINEAYTEYIKTYVESLPNDYKDEIYNTQIQKVRDSKRLSDLNKIDLMINMYYADNSEYPAQISNELLEPYLFGGGFPVDELEGQLINGCKFGYKYELEEDNSEDTNRGYRLSTCLESESDTIKQKLIDDNGKYDNRYEVGNFSID